MTIKLYDANKGELMAISSLEQNGNALVIRGKIYGSMPMSATLRPEEVRKVFSLLSIRLILFILTLPFRKAVASEKK